MLRGKCANCFCEQDHSGMSAEFTIHLIEKLLKGELLSPLTNNPDEWTDVSDFQGCSYQSKEDFLATELKLLY